MGILTPNAANTFNGSGSVVSNGQGGLNTNQNSGLFNQPKPSSILSGLTLPQAPSTQSSGLQTVQIAATNDLDFITDEANVTINLALNGLDKLKLSDILDQKQVDFIWDATKNELIEEIVI